MAGASVLSPQALSSVARGNAQPLPPQVLLLLLQQQQQEQQQQEQDQQQETILAPSHDANPAVSLYHWWHASVPHVARFFVSGNIGNLCLYFTERALFYYLSHGLLPQSLPSFVQDYKDTISFFLGYILNIVAQHYMHAVLVYGLDSINTPQKYWTTLGGMYSALLSSSIGCTIVNTILLHEFHMDKTVAFVTTLTIFSCFNYFIIGWIVQRSNHAAATKKSKTVETITRGGHVPPRHKQPLLSTLVGFMASTNESSFATYPLP